MKYEHRSKAVCVDFDGVIAELSLSIEDIGQVIPGAVEGIRKLRELGYKIIIHTARPSHPEHVKKIEEHLKAEGVPYDEIGVNSDCEWDRVELGGITRSRSQCFTRYVTQNTLLYFFCDSRISRQEHRNLV